MKDRRCNWPHGRGLGGSTIINYAIYTRGNRRDFDRISAAGNPGWNFENILPFYQKLEKSIVKAIDDTDSFGKMGLLQIEESKFKTSIAEAFVKSATHLNHSLGNYNSGDQIGVSYLQSTTRNGWRQTAARAYLSHIRHRRNLDISLRSWATKLLFNANGDQVKGITFVRNKQEFTVKVRNEVILAAGAFESPKLLMLSGIGPEEHLHDLNIKVIKNLPVGKTLYEHIAVFGPIFTADNVTDGLVNMNDIIQLKPLFEILEGKGPLTSTGVESLLYMKTNNSISTDPGYPDIELIQSFATLAFDASQGIREGVRMSQETYNAVFRPIENRRAFQILPLLLHPRSKGYLKLKNRNPFHHPFLYPNFFSDPRDIDTLLEGIRETIKITQQPEFVELGVRLYNVTVPGCEETVFNTDEYWRCYIRHLSATLHHQIGTCKMGPNAETAVVDSRGVVHGFKNLRVADVSIIPEPPSAHTAALSFVIGEKISDTIRNDWSPNESNIQKLARHRKSVDWQYQDPAYTTEALLVTRTTQSRLVNQHVTTTRPKPELKYALDSLNMSALHEQSQQFKNSTIGDVGLILWGSPIDAKPIDFKSKLAENANSTKVNSSKNQKIKSRIIKHRLTKKTTTTTTKVRLTTLFPSTNGNTMNSTEPQAIQTFSLNKDTAFESSTKLSNMDKIMATAPSLDADTVDIYKTMKHKIEIENMSEQLNQTYIPDEMKTAQKVQNTHVENGNKK